MRFRLLPAGALGVLPTIGSAVAVRPILQMASNPQLYVYM